ncbi:helix-turn-helix transcriptional regulator [Algiphilus aromaticivorans]|uniref:helix-turn-helix transcriptional regulator n=1 Tax=Algiphilus aromaticivorans TaxID=382454 RepID=UPI0018DE364E|nr:hypothetical protein [Algiphilus aromaticivorans]
MEQKTSLVPQPELRRRFGGISDMTVWRWRKDGFLPPPTVIRRRNYWPENVVQKLLQGEPAGECSQGKAA